MRMKLTEYVTDDLLLLTRAVFIGSGTLEMYAEDPKGQFRDEPKRP